MTKHDDKVRKLANSYKRKGYKVKADLSGFEQPNKIGQKNYIPDLEFTKSGSTKIIEVETKQSIKKDQNQITAFRRSAAHRKRTSFDLEQI